MLVEPLKVAVTELRLVIALVVKWPLWQSATKSPTANPASGLSKALSVCTLTSTFDPFVTVVFRAAE